MGISVKFRAFLFLFLCAVLLSPLFTVSRASAGHGDPAENGAALSIDPSALTVTYGSPFQVVVRVSTVPGVMTRGAQCELHFDNDGNPATPPPVQCTGVQPGTYFSDWASANAATALHLGVPPTINNTAGTVSMVSTFLAGGTGGPSGSGTFMIYNFTPVRSGTVTISVVNGSVGNPEAQPLPLQVYPGTRTVIGGPAPDLGISEKQDILVPNTNNFKVRFRIINSGNWGSVATTARVSLNSIPQLFLDVQVPALAAGASSNYLETGEIPITLPPPLVKICADALNVEEESNESNNCLENRLALADFNFSGIYKDWVIQDQTYNISAMLVNSGTRPGDVQVNISIDGQVAGFQTLLNMLPGENRTVFFPGPFSITELRDTVTLMADYDNLVPELEEGNNNIELVVQATPPLLGDARLWIVPASLDVNYGAVFSVPVHIRTEDGVQTRGAQCGLNFDDDGNPATPPPVQCIGVTPGTFYSSWAAANGAMTYHYGVPPSINTVAGTVSVVSTTIFGGPPWQGPSGSGTFMVFNFLPVRAGTVDITITEGGVSNTQGIPLSLDVLNGTRTVVGAPLPDLVVSEKTEVIAEGSSQFRIKYNVANTGRGDAGATVARVFIDGTAHAEYDVEIPFLAAGQWSGYIFVPPFSEPGFDISLPPPSVKVCADINDSQQESDEDNNCQESVLTLADFSFMAINKEWVIPNRTYMVHYTLLNAGTRTSNCAVGLWINGHQVASQSLTGISAGQSVNGVFQGPYTVTPPYDNIFLFADFNSRVFELDESNNIIAGTVKPARWDINGDGICNIFDIILLSNRWLQTGPPGWIGEDINEDGIVNLYDVIILSNHWMETW